MFVNMGQKSLKRFAEVGFKYANYNKFDKLIKSDLSWHLGRLIHSYLKTNLSVYISNLVPFNGDPWLKLKI